MFAENRNGSHMFMLRTVRGGTATRTTTVLDVFAWNMINNLGR